MCIWLTTVKFPQRGYYTEVDKTENCIRNEHGLCNGDIVEFINGSKTIKICQCQCHDNMYQLVRRMHISDEMQ